MLTAPPPIAPIKAAKTALTTSNQLIFTFAISKMKVKSKPKRLKSYPLRPLAHIPL